MRTIARILASAIPVAATAQQLAPRPSLVFDGGTVIDVEHGKLLANQRVVITGNRIQRVGSMSAVKLPKGAQVVDARGKYLIPGLWDLHVHPVRETLFAYPLFIANGVTGIRDAGSDVPLATLNRWRREILAGTRVGPPRQLQSGGNINEIAKCDVRIPPWLASSGTLCVFDSADARHLVDSLKAAGADMIKPREVSRHLDFVLAAEARRLGIPFGGHASYLTPIEASDSGFRIIDHMQSRNEGVGPGTMVDGIAGRCWGGQPTASVERCRPVAERFRKNGTWLVPTLFPYSPGWAHTYGGGRRADAIALGFNAQPSSERHGNWLHDIVNRHDTGESALPISAADSLGSMSIMQRVGMPILTGTDVHGVSSSGAWGFALHVELAMLVAEGLTPLNALQAATINPARMWHSTDSLGTVASGKLADLILLDADPLADITNTTTIRAVVANGHYFDRAALDQLIVAARAQPKAP